VVLQTSNKQHDGTSSDVVSIPDVESLDKRFMIVGNTIFLGVINVEMFL